MYGGTGADWSNIGVDPEKGQQWQFRTNRLFQVEKPLNAPQGNTYYE
jgi:hypothetical protein